MTKNPHLGPSSSETRLRIFSWPPPGERGDGCKIWKGEDFFINNVVEF